MCIRDSIVTVHISSDLINQHLNLFYIIICKQVQVLIDKITTDMNGHDINHKLLSQVSTKVKFSKLNPSGADVTGTGVTVSFAAYNKMCIRDRWKFL